MALDGDDAAIYFTASDGTEWAEFIREKLWKEYCIATTLNDVSFSDSHKAKSQRLNIFFVTPDFLDLKHAQWSVLDHFSKDISLIVLTGITAEDIDVVARDRFCPYVLEWETHELTGSEESVRDLLVLIIGLYEDQSRRLSDNLDDPYDKLPDERPRQVNGVFDVTYKDGTVYVFLERKAEGKVAVNFGTGEHVPHLRHTDIAVYALNHVAKETTSLTIMLDDGMIGEAVFSPGEQKFSDVRTIVEEPPDTPPPTPHKVTKSASTQTDTVSDPSVSDPSQPVQLKPSVMMNYDVPPPPAHVKRKPKLEQLRELLEAETDAIKLMCECLGLETDLNQLDERLASLVAFSESVKGLLLPGIQSQSEKGQTNTKWPTLFHFGARYNLVRFCKSLPLMHEALVTLNMEGQTPRDVAQSHGHTELAEWFDRVALRKNGKCDSGIGRESYPDTLAPPTPHAVPQYCNVPSGSTGGRARKNAHTDLEADDEYVNKEQLLQFKKKIQEDTDDTFDEIKDDDMEGNSDSLYLDMGSPQSPYGMDQRLSDASISSASPSVDGFPYGQTHAPYVGKPRAPSISSLDTLTPTQQTDGKHKDIVALLGMTTPTTPEPKKKSSLGGFFKKKNSRSQSVPVVPSEEEIKRLRRKKDKSKKKGTADSPRSSGTSTDSGEFRDRKDSWSGRPTTLSFGVSDRPTTKRYQKKVTKSHSMSGPRHISLYRPGSGNSTASEFSMSRISDIKEQDPDEVEKRQKDGEKSKLSFFKKSASKRKSVRMKKAFEEDHVIAPRLPNRRTNEQF